MGKKSKARTARPDEAAPEEIHSSSGPGGKREADKAFAKAADAAERLLIEGQGKLEAGNPSQALRCFQRARATSLGLVDRDHALVIERVAIGHLATVYLKMGDYKQCITLAEQSIDACERAGDNGRAATSRNNRDVACVGEANRLVNQSQKLLECVSEPSDGSQSRQLRHGYEEARSLVTEAWQGWGTRISDGAMRGKVERTYYLMIGNAEMRLGEFPHALEHYQRCLTLSEAAGDTSDQEVAKSNLQMATAGMQRAITEVLLESGSEP